MQFGHQSRIRRSTSKAAHPPGIVCHYCDPIHHHSNYFWLHRANQRRSTCENDFKRCDSGRTRGKYHESCFRSRCPRLEEFPNIDSYQYRHYGGYDHPGYGIRFGFQCSRDDVFNFHRARQESSVQDTIRAAGIGKFKRKSGGSQRCFRFVPYPFPERIRCSGTVHHYATRKPKRHCGPDGNV